MTFSNARDSVGTIDSVEDMSVDSYSTVLRWKVLSLDERAPTQAKHPVTVILAQGTNGKPVIAQTLLNTCCTGTGLVHSDVIKDLGLCINDTGT